MRRWLVAVLGLGLIGVAAHIVVLHALPYVIMRIAMSRISGSAAVNTAIFPPRATATARTIVRPSPDLLYAVCVFDLSDGPVHLSAQPPTTYWSLSAFADNTDNFFVINNAALQQPTVEVLLVAAGDSVVAAPGVRVVESPSRRGIVLTRSLLLSDAEQPEIDRLRRTFRCEAQP